MWRAFPVFPSYCSRYFDSRGVGGRATSHASAICAIDVALIGLVGGCAAVSFAASLSTPFLFDDYTHLDDAAQATWRTMLTWFTTPTNAPFFDP